MPHPATMDFSRAQALAARQQGLVARRQLNLMGYDADHVRNQVAAGRWVERSPTVVSTFTGALGRAELVWLGVLHAGGSALVGGLTALEQRGLRSWEREDVTVLVEATVSLDPVPGVRFFRTRRPLRQLRTRGRDLPLCRVEPAALLFAGYERSPRTAQGLVAAVVQQRLTTPAALLEELECLRPLRRSSVLRTVLTDIEGGAQSMAELDVNRMCRRFGLPRPQRQRRRRDAAGRVRFTDCEWVLPDGRVLVLEIDGAFHMEVEHWEDDLARERRLVTPGRIVVRATAREVRDEPEALVRDLEALGLRRSCA